MSKSPFDPVVTTSSEPLTPELIERAYAKANEAAQNYYPIDPSTWAKGVVDLETHPMNPWPKLHPYQEQVLNRFLSDEHVTYGMGVRHHGREELKRLAADLDKATAQAKQFLADEPRAKTVAWDTVSPEGEKQRLQLVGKNRKERRAMAAAARKRRR